MLVKCNSSQMHFWLQRIQMNQSAEKSNLIKDFDNEIELTFGNWLHLFIFFESQKKKEKCCYVEKFWSAFEQSKSCSYPRRDREIKSKESRLYSTNRSTLEKTDKTDQNWELSGTEQTPSRTEHFSNIVFKIRNSVPKFLWI